MAVLIEGLSVVVRCQSIGAVHVGSYELFVAEAPNQTLCVDGELARIGFMIPADVKNYVEHLESRGLRYHDGGVAQDLVVVDQLSGFRAKCDWAIFGSANWNGDPECVIAVCQAKPSRVGIIAVPKGWVYQSSLSAQYKFVEEGKIPPSLRLIRRESGVDVFVDAQTGQEWYVRRSY